MKRNLIETIRYLLDTALVQVKKIKILYLYLKEATNKV